MYEYRQLFTEKIRSSADREWGSKKEQLVSKYGWVVPNSEIVSVLREEDQILEVGAGNGYLANVVNTESAIVYPTDKYPPSKTWTNIHELGLQDIVRDEGSVPTTKIILTAWPPADSTLDVEIVQELEPSVLYYIGDLNSKVTGSADMENVMSAYSITEQIPVNGWLNTEYMYKFVL